MKRWYLNLTQARSKLMAIRGLAIQEHMPPIVVDRPATGDFLLMHFYTPARIVTERQTFEVTPHSVYIWPPDAHQCFGNAQNAWLHSWIHCDGSRVQAALESCGAPLGQPLQLEDGRLTEKYLRAIYDEMSEFVEPDPLILEGLFAVWMRELARASRVSPQSRTIPRRLVTVRQLIDNDPARPMTLGMLAAEAALSVTQFSAEFRRFFKTSPMNYVLRVRMHRALHYLSDHSMNISEVAQRCGFADPFYFSKQFKKHFGTSPRDYRRTSTKRNFQ